MLKFKTFALGESETTSGIDVNSSSDTQGGSSVNSGAGGSGCGGGGGGGFDGGGPNGSNSNHTIVSHTSSLACGGENPSSTHVTHRFHGNDPHSKNSQSNLLLPGDESNGTAKRTNLKPVVPGGGPPKFGGFTAPPGEVDVGGSAQLDHMMMIMGGRGMMNQSSLYPSGGVRSSNHLPPQSGSTPRQIQSNNSPGSPNHHRVTFAPTGDGGYGTSGPTSGSFCAPDGTDASFLRRNPKASSSSPSTSTSTRLSDPTSRSKTLDHRSSAAHHLTRVMRNHPTISPNHHNGYPHYHTLHQSSAYRADGGNGYYTGNHHQYGSVGAGGRGSGGLNNFSGSSANDWNHLPGSPASPSGIVAFARGGILKNSPVNSTGSPASSLGGCERSERSSSHGGFNPSSAGPRSTSPSGSSIPSPSSSACGGNENVAILRNAGITGSTPSHSAAGVASPSSSTSGAQTNSNMLTRESLRARQFFSPLSEKGETREKETSHAIFSPLSEKAGDTSKSRTKSESSGGVLHHNPRSPDAVFAVQGTIPRRPTKESNALSWNPILSQRELSRRNSITNDSPDMKASGSSGSSSGSVTISGPNAVFTTNFSNPNTSTASFSRGSSTSSTFATLTRTQQHGGGGGGS